MIFPKLITKMNYINNDVKWILKDEIYYREEERKKGTGKIYGIIDWNERATVVYTMNECSLDRAHALRSHCHSVAKWSNGWVQVSLFDPLAYYPLDALKAEKSDSR